MAAAVKKKPEVFKCELTPDELDLVRYRDCAAKCFLFHELKKLRVLLRDLRCVEPLSGLEEKIASLSSYYRLEISDNLSKLSDSVEPSSSEKILLFVKKRIDEGTFWHNEILARIPATKTLSQESELLFIWSNFMNQEFNLTSKVLSKLKDVKSYSEAREVVQAFSPHLIHRFDHEFYKKGLNNPRLLHEITKLVSNTNVYMRRCIKKLEQS